MNMEGNLVNKSRKELHKIIQEYQSQIHLKDEELENMRSLLNVYEKKLEIFDRKQKENEMKIATLENDLKKRAIDKYKGDALQEGLINLLSDIETLNTIKNERIESLETENIELKKRKENKVYSQSQLINKKSRNSVIFKWIKNWVYKSPRVKKVYRLFFVK
ncbi:hypothetical protein H6227_002520 [Enterococcus faecalis]|nr:hypothetical protein [Enterococcus faecalis]